MLGQAQGIGAFYPGVNTAWVLFGTVERYRCKFSVQLTNELAALSEHHAEPEMMSHLFVYKGKEMLLYWHDAFDSVIWLSATLEETRVMAFAKKFGLEARLIEMHKIDDVAS